MANQILTPREAEISRLAGTGTSNQAIADQLNISPATVETHMKTIRRKLGVTGRKWIARFSEDTQ